MVQWLQLCACTPGDVGLIPGWGTKSTLAVQLKEKKDNLRIGENLKFYKFKKLSNQPQMTLYFSHQSDMI